MRPTCPQRGIIILDLDISMNKDHYAYYYICGDIISLIWPLIQLINLTIIVVIPNNDLYLGYPALVGECPIEWNAGKSPPIEQHLQRIL